MEHDKPNYRHKERRGPICTPQLGLYRSTPGQNKAASLTLVCATLIQSTVFTTICLALSNALNTQVTTMPHGKL